MISFDVIIPHYGGPAHLERALESVIAQDARPASIIVVDDGSEKPVQLAPRLTERGVRLIRHPVNKGAAAARNTGIRAATAEWLTFLDSDDRLLPGSLARRSALIHHDQQQAADRRRAYACGWEERGIDGRFLRARQPEPATRFEDFLSGCWFAPGTCLFINRAFIVESDCYLDERLRLLEDLDWFARLGGHGLVLKPLPVIGAALEIRRDHDAKRLTEAVVRLRAKWRELLGESPALRRLDAYLELELAATAYWDQRYLSAMRHMLASVRAFPRASMHLSPGCKTIAVA